MYEICLISKRIPFIYVVIHEHCTSQRKLLPCTKQAIVYTEDDRMKMKFISEEDVNEKFPNPNPRHHVQVYNFSFVMMENVKRNTQSKMLKKNIHEWETKASCNLDVLQCHHSCARCHNDET